MIARTFSAITTGLTPTCIEVEVGCYRGVPGLQLIGLPTKTVEEAKERITAALAHCGIRIRSKRTVVNLAPADLRKNSSAFELAIAVGLLAQYGEIPPPAPDTIFFGEFALDGTLKPLRGTLALVLGAQELGFQHVIFPKSNHGEVATLTGITLHPLDHLQTYISCAQRKSYPPALQPAAYHVKENKESNGPSEQSYAHICAQPLAQRALEVAAAGGHNLLLSGPPGVGKSIVAHSITSILPPLSQAEALEASTIHSLSGEPLEHLLTHPPFRSPHHSITHHGLIGGGSPIKPGEISLAHRGVLFLDELLEFKRATLEALRQPLETGSITLTRNGEHVRYPSRVTLVAATNPCPCGYADSVQKPCTCTPGMKERYRSRLSGPFLDRIDLQVAVKEVALEQLQPSTSSTLTTTRERVLQARRLQQTRLRDTPFHTNAEVLGTHLISLSAFSHTAVALATRAASTLTFSARSYFKLLSVARTVADLENELSVADHHVAEALSFRLQS